MKKNIYYETVSEAINDLVKRGYTSDFEMLKEKECLVCNQTSAQLSPDDFEIDETYRFEGDSDPGDEMIVFAVSSKEHNIKGIIVNAYGLYSDSSTAKIVERLKNHMKTDLPIKRSEFLKPLSREHHHGLLFCWKIRVGIKKNVEVSRIKKYADWFYQNYLLPHFEVEEKYVFTILGNENELIKRAISEHRRLKRLFESTTEIQKNLSLIEEELEGHIRFEERILFGEIQKNSTVEQLQFIKVNHSDEKFVDNLVDPFWE